MTECELCEKRSAILDFNRVCCRVRFVMSLPSREMRAGWLERWKQKDGAPPESLAGRDFSIRYISPLARAQKLEDVTAIERLHMNIANIAQVKPEVLDLIDEDSAVRVLSDALGVPTKVLRKSADVDQLRQRRAQQQQGAMQKEQMAQIQQVASTEMIKKAVSA